MRAVPPAAAHPAPPRERFTPTRPHEYGPLVRDRLTAALPARLR